MPERIAGINKLMSTALKSALETHLSMDGPMKKPI